MSERVGRSRRGWVRIVSAIAVTTVVVCHADAQWNTYTMKRDVRDLALGSDSTLWVATSGGLFSFHFAESMYQQFTTSEGLRSVDLSAVTVDNEGTVWIGATNGFLHRYNPATRTWQYITDISGRRDPQKRINRLRVRGDTLIILSDIGASFFSISRMEFGDTYMQYGSGSSMIDGDVTDFEMFDGRMWISTRTGIASTATTNPNPAVPESWQVYTLIQGLPSISVTGLAILDTALYASTAAGLAIFSGSSSSWSTVAGTAGLNILDISDELSQAAGCGRVLEFITRFDSLQILRRSELWSYATTGSVTRLSAAFPSFLSAISHEGILGSQASGAIVYNACPNDTMSEVGIVSVLVPPGPLSNKFIGIATDKRGVVWSATGAANGEGFMSFDGATWRQYTVSLDPRLSSNDFYKVSIGANDSKWISNFGYGAALLDDRGELQRMLNATNGLLPTVDPGFVVIGGVATDRNGVAWITDRTPPGDTSIVLFKPDSSFDYVVGCGPGCSTRRPSAILSDVVIDEYGTKWFPNFSRFEPFVPDRFSGFLYYNENVALPGTSGGWGRLTTSDGLTSVQVWSVAVDRDGAVWVGTDQGISIIFNPTNPRAGIAAYRPPLNEVIQGIVVDPLNNKWVATKRGVFVLSPDGTSILDHYTVENTDGKLLDNDVASIAMDRERGIMYFGTEKGLTSLTTSAVEPKRSFDELSFAPNPFHVPSPSTVMVDGLVAGSTLKILSIDGNLIREIRTPGGRIGFWDGRDERGYLVSTGVYIVVAYSEDGSKVAKGKLAVIRN